MFTLKIESDTHLIFTLTQNENMYQITNIEGLNPPEAEVFYSPVANMAGGRYKASKVQARNIVITLRIQGNVEDNRLNLYRCFRSGNWCKIYYANDSRDVYIEGYVETIENNPFTMQETCQISIICPRPYWKDAETIVTDLSKTIGAFTFPFSISSSGKAFSTITHDQKTTIVNHGDVECGVIIRVTSLANGIGNLVITHEDLSNTTFTVNTTLNNGDVLVINTNKGEKSITKNGENAMASVGAGSTWFSLLTGSNTFSYTASSTPEKLLVTFEMNELYEGV